MPLSPLSQLLASPVSMLRDGGDGGVGGGDDVPFLEESPFLQRQLSAEIRNMQSDDARNLANSGLSLCLDENGNSDLSFCLDDNGLPFLELPAPPPTEGEPAPPAPLAPLPLPAPKYDGPFAGCELKITGHQFHESHPENIATNIKWFTMDVALVDENNSLVQDKTLPLRATLIFENGATVLKNMEQDEEPLKGQTNVVVIHGGASFKMKVGKQITSELRNKQRFRVLIEPVDDTVRRACPALTLHSEAFKVMVKIHRPENRPRGGAPPPSLDPAQAPLGLPPLAATGGSAAATATDVAPSGDNAENSNDALRLRLDEQEAQIRRLTEQNASILEAMAKLREEVAIRYVAKRPARGADAAEQGGEDPLAVPFPVVVPPEALRVDGRARAAAAAPSARRLPAWTPQGRGKGTKRPAADPPETIRSRPQRARRSA